MPIIKIDNLTSFPLPADLQANKLFWELFPYKADIDLVEGSYGGQPLSEEQTQFFMTYPHADWKFLRHDEKLYPAILKRTIEELQSLGLEIDPDYKSLLQSMAMVMSSTIPLDHPVVITTRPGLGKTQMLTAMLIEKIKHFKDYTAVVVTGRVEDSVRISEHVNAVAGRKTCEVRPTFTLMTLGDKKCLNGHGSKDHYHGICRQINCTKNRCPVKRSDRDHPKRKVEFITSKHFNRVVDDDLLEDLMEYGPVYNPGIGRKEMLIRDELIIDENPGMVFNPMITNKMLNDCMTHLKKNAFHQDLISEFHAVMMFISGEMGGRSDYEYTDGNAIEVRLSKEFRAAWRIEPHPKHPDMPLVLNLFLSDGGIRRNRNNVVGYVLGTGRYRTLNSNTYAEVEEEDIEPNEIDWDEIDISEVEEEYLSDGTQEWLPFRTTILDGSGLKDLTYRPEEFYLLAVPEIRDMTRSSLHRYPLNLSKSYLQSKPKENKIEGIANEAIRVTAGRPALFVTYKEHRDKFSELFEKHEYIRINHFGNLIGRNDYVDCEVVFFAGLHDWGAIEYFTQVTAVGDKQYDLTTLQNKSVPFKDPEVRKFYSTLLAIGLYQDLMRSNLRVHSGKEPVDIYIWTTNHDILNRLQGLLPGVNILNERIPESLKNSRHSDVIASEVESILNQFKQSLTEEQLGGTPKKSAILITKELGRIPTRAEVEFVFGAIAHGHYSRWKKHAEAYLEETN